MSRRILTRFSGIATLCPSLVGCHGGSGISFDSVECPIAQSGMTGDLSQDIVGLWHIAWGEPNQPGSVDMIVEFHQDGSALSFSEKSGETRWYYAIHGTQGTNVNMNDLDADDLAMLFTTWQYVDGSWAVTVTGAGDTMSERCAYKTD